MVTVIEKEDLVARLEREIDRCGLHCVLQSLVMICDLKAEHIAHTWQDTTIAKQWAKAGTTIENAAAKIGGI